MEGFVKLVGIVMVVIGAIYFVKPNLMKKTADFFMKEKWIYAGAIVSLIIGIIFLRAASQCAISWLVIIFGVLALSKGIAIFVFGQKRIKSLLDTLTKKPTKALRVFAAVKIVLGVVLVYCA